MSDEPATEDGDLRHIPLDLITPNPRQPRRSFDQETLQALADSIKLQGILGPVVVRESGPLDVQGITEQVGLHPNTVRSHLDKLVEAGLALMAAVEEPVVASRVALTTLMTVSASFRA